MRPARTTKKTNPVSSSKGATTASSQGRRDAGAVVSKLLIADQSGAIGRLLKPCLPKSISLRANEQFARVIAKSLQICINSYWRPNRKLTKLKRLAIEILWLQIRLCLTPPDWFVQTKTQRSSSSRSSRCAWRTTTTRTSRRTSRAR